MSTTTVVLVHGLGSSYDHNWREQGWVDVLEDVDFSPRESGLPGHANRPMERSVEDTILSSLSDIEHPVAGVGFSAGAIGLLRTAAREPGRFSRLALLGIGDAMLTDRTDEVRALATSLRAGEEPTDPRTRTLWRLIDHTGNARGLVADYLESDATSLGGVSLGRVRCPTLLVVGERDPSGPADALSTMLADCRTVTLPGVDHFATTAAGACVDVVTRFLSAEH